MIFDVSFVSQTGAADRFPYPLAHHRVVRLDDGEVLTFGRLLRLVYSCLNRLSTVFLNQLRQH